MRQPRLGNHSLDIPRRVISFWNVGGDNPRGAGSRYRAANPGEQAMPPLYMLGYENWSEFVQHRIEPEYEWGIRRWLIHNPFGTPYQGPMIFDQYLLAPEFGLEKLTGDFSIAWKRFLEAHADVEVIFYLGKLHGLERFDRHLPGRPDLWLERAWRSAEPILALVEHGASLAFDAAASAPHGSPAHRFVQLVTGLGTRTYIESWPFHTMPHWATHNVICAERRRGVFAVGGEGIAQDHITGEIIWLINSNLAKVQPGQREHDVATPEGLFNLADELLHLSPHYSVATPVRGWMEKDLTLDVLQESLDSGALPAVGPVEQTALQDQPKFGRHADGTIVIEEPRSNLEDMRSVTGQLRAETYRPPENHWQLLPRTRKRLLNGPTLKIVSLGDSIMNDTNRSGWTRVLEQAYPNCEIAMTTVVRGATGSRWYKEEGRLAKYVLPWNPDLVVIGGINNSHPDDVREVIRQIRAGSQAEILLLSGAFGRGHDPGRPNYNGRAEIREQLRTVADEMRVAYFDIRDAWAEAIRRECEDPEVTIEDFKRDEVHANGRGWHLLGRLMARYFEADLDSPQP